MPWKCVVVIELENVWLIYAWLTHSSQCAVQAHHLNAPQNRNCQFFFICWSIPLFYFVHEFIQIFSRLSDHLLTFPPIRLQHSNIFTDQT